VTLLCQVRQGMRPWAHAHLEDISRKGFRIAWLPNAQEDRPQRIRIPGLRLLTARIRWRDGKSVGCEFAETLHVTVFEHIVRASRGQ